jgi:hypothetical protein
MTEDRHLAVRFGENQISDPRLRVHVTYPANNPATATLIVPNDLINTASLDYRSPVEIVEIVDGEDHQAFTGFVDEVTPEGSEVRFNLTTQTQIMSETRMGGLGYAGVSRLEIVWAVTRLGGYLPENIVIEGWEPGPTEVFEVATAIDGLFVEKPIRFGRVSLLPDGPVTRLAEGLGPEVLRERYDSGPVWALVPCTAKTLLEAEEEAIREMDFALGWLMARAHYSSVSLPGRQPGAYRRQWTLSRVLRKDVIVARGLSTGRRWLRAPRDIPWQPALSLVEIADIGLPVLPPDTPIQLREAINAWRRAAEASDLFEAVVALNDAMEFYVSNVSLPKLFTKDQKKSIRENATRGLAGDQKKRVSDVLNDMLNAPSLMMKLQKALEDNEVPHTEGEVQLLTRVRNKRNALVHGRSREAPVEDDVRYAVALVNRMLVYKVAALGQAD